MPSLLASHFVLFGKSQRGQAFSGPGSLRYPVSDWIWNDRRCQLQKLRFDIGYHNMCWHCIVAFHTEAAQLLATTL